MPKNRHGKHRHTESLNTPLMQRTQTLVNTQEPQTPLPPQEPEPSSEPKQNQCNLREPDDRRTSGIHISYWLDSTEPLEFSALTEDTKVDTVVVGGGMAGISTAYMLARQGQSVAVVEDGFVGSGETGRTTAHLANALDEMYYDVEKYFGEEGARKAAASHTAAIHTIEDNIRRENISCDFERLPGYLFLHPTDKAESLQKEYESSQKAGLKTKMIEGVPGVPLETGPCLVFPDQAIFHPLHYLQGLCKALLRYGGKIYTKTHADKIHAQGIEAGKYKIEAKNIVVATNTPVNDKVVIHTKQSPYRTYVIAALIPKNSLARALFWDTGDQESPWTTYPYHYVRPQNYDETHDLLIIGGEDHKTGQANREELPEKDRYKELEDWARKRFPMMQTILYHWSGQVMEPVDGLAFIGRNPLDAKNVYIVTGDSGQGMTHGTIASILLSDLILGKENEWEGLYDPSRKSLKTLDDFALEQANVMKQFADYVTGGDIDDVQKLEVGQGAIVRDGLSKVAVYRDLDGQFFAFSAVCPHMKCIVHWNADEKTFDCPCHGSRFTCFGKVVHGPASISLTCVDVPGSKASTCSSCASSQTDENTVR